MTRIRTATSRLPDIPDIPDRDRDRNNPVYAVNQIVRDWGHTFLYDERTLTQLLSDDGFSGDMPQL